MTIGKFDGVHIGHRSILNELERFKKEKGLESVVLTFDFSYFSGKDGERLNSFEEKTAILKSEGIDVMIDYPFDEDIKRIKAEDFVRSVLVKRLGAKAVIVGENFRFGFEAKGDPSLLKEMGKEFGFEVVVIPCINYEGSVVSSSRIRIEKKEGHTEKVKEMLGY